MHDIATELDHHQSFPSFLRIILTDNTLNRSEKFGVLKYCSVTRALIFKNLS